MSNSSAAPPQTPAKGIASGTWAVVVLAIFCLLFILASFYDPLDLFVNEGEPPEPAVQEAP